MKIVINRSYGGFGLSDACLTHMGITFSHEVCNDYGHPFEWRKCEEEDTLQRTDPRLIKAIEELGSEACSGPHAELEIVEIPDNLIHWHIREYDGLESIVASESPILYF